jgi:hypothetical protein
MFIIAASQNAVPHRSAMCSDMKLFNNVMLRYVTQALQTNCSNTIFISVIVDVFCKYYLLLFSDG